MFGSVVVGSVVAGSIGFVFIVVGSGSVVIFDILVGHHVGHLVVHHGGGGDKEMKFGQNCDLTNLFD